MEFCIPPPIKWGWVYNFNTPLLYEVIMGFGAILGAVGGGLLGGPIGSLIGAGIGGGAESIGGAFLGNYFNKKSQSRANKYALYMSSTAHQREVADLKAAGLNPVLSTLGNGAATVSIPVGNGGNPLAGAGGDIEGAANAANSAVAASKFGKTSQALSLEGQAVQNHATQAQADAALSAANASTTEADLNTAKAAGQRIDNAIKAEQSNYYKDLPKPVKNAVSMAMLTGNGSAPVVAQYLHGLDSGNTAIGGVKEIGKTIGKGVSKAFDGYMNFTDKYINQPLYNGYQRLLNGDSSGTHSSASQLQKMQKNEEKLNNYLNRKRKAGYLF